uniref:Uncharacterized protein n=1 Tax=Leptocylindrus danicus TaxID=163516 RepID=A0A7S2JZ48_9STRA|mmetsp:Transcript_1377/g.1996  ORF Transcript_1377/g.1996 Transcript_1377/m.1996 type:complete len:878 (+) Transcript_1377:80-2713(+)
MRFSIATVLALSSASSTTAFVAPKACLSSTRSTHNTFALSAAKNDKNSDDDNEQAGLPIDIDLDQAKKQMKDMTDGWAKMVSNSPFGVFQKEEKEEEEKVVEEVHNSMFVSIKKSVMDPVMNKMEEMSKKEESSSKKQQKSKTKDDAPIASSIPFVDSFKKSLMNPVAGRVATQKPAATETGKEVKPEKEVTVVDSIKKNLTSMVDPVVNTMEKKEMPQDFEESAPALDTNKKVELDMNTESATTKDEEQAVQPAAMSSMSKTADETKKAISNQWKKLPKLDLDVDKQKQQAGEVGGKLAKMAVQNPVLGIIKTDLVDPIMSKEVERNVPYEIITGATVGFAGVALLAGFSMAESLAVGAAAAYLAITPGKVGDGVRKAGNLTWAAGGKSWDTTRMIGGVTRDVIEASTEGGVEGMMKTLMESIETQRLEQNDPSGLKQAMRQYEAAQHKAEQAKERLREKTQQGIERKAMEVRAATMVMRRNAERTKVGRVNEDIARKAEEVRLATSNMRVMQSKLVEEQEKLKLAEEEQARLVQEAKLAEEARLARELEATLLEEERRAAEEQEQAEKEALLQRIAEEARLAAEEERQATLAKQRRLEAEALLAQQEAKARDALKRKAQEIIEWKAKDVRIATEIMRAESAHKEMEIKLALEEKQRAAEQARLEEQQRLEEQREKARLAEEARIAEEQRMAFEATVARLAEEARIAEEQRMEQMRIEAEARQKDEELEVRERLKAKAQAIIEWKAEDVRIATEMMRAEAAQKEEERLRELYAEAVESIERKAVEVRLATQVMREDQARLEEERQLIAAEEEKAAIAAAQEAFERQQLLMKDEIQEEPTTSTNDNGGKGFSKDSNTGKKNKSKRKKNHKKNYLDSI